MQSVVANTMAMKPSSNNSNHNQNQNQNQNHNTNHKPRHDALTVSSIKKQQRELEDPATKAEMKSMAARALRYLCAGNVNICRSVTESRALLCLAVLLEKGHEDVRYNSALALMEITAVAEQDSSLRRSAFKPTAPVAKAVVEQFLGIIEKPDSELMVPSIRSIGNLARTFRATETRFIRPLVKLLDETEPEVMCEAALALNKFAGPDNFLHETHCKEIIKEGGIKHLQPQVYFGEVGLVQLPCFVLLCYLAMHVPDSEELANEDVIHILEWAAKQQVFIQDKEMETLVNEAKNRLELYQSRGSKGYH
ncbi:armadillo repeat only 1 [Striga asiatica]|uniref:Armadillo repeat only 1 n=1 Tax=Striga asiatica TaxID=4170 RepID=A0A5A7QRH6_STRAF|nr:armadillo repeat only 1 [Striga asiatica]